MSVLTWGRGGEKGGGGQLLLRTTVYPAFIFLPSHKHSMRRALFSRFQRKKQKLTLANKAAQGHTALLWQSKYLNPKSSDQRVSAGTWSIRTKDGTSAAIGSSLLQQGDIVQATGQHCSPEEGLRELAQEGVLRKERQLAWAAGARQEVPASRGHTEQSQR